MTGGWDHYADDWSRLHGGYDPRSAPLLVRGWLRLGYRLARILAPVRVSPSAITTAGLVLSLAVPVLVWQGWLLAGAVLVFAAALADTVDGAVAVVAARASRLGQVYDSVADRLGEACWLLALWLAGVPVWLAVLCGGLAWLHEYTRARAGVAGMTEVGVVTLGERPTRVLLVLFALGLSGLAGLVGGAAGGELAVGTVTAVCAIWATLAGVGLAQLAGAVRQALRP